MTAVRDLSFTLIYFLFTQALCEITATTTVYFVIKPKGKKWTYQDESAVVIQKYIRRHLAKKELEKRKKEKQDYEDLMEKIQKEVRYL